MYQNYSKMDFPPPSVAKSTQHAIEPAFTIINPFDTPPEAEPTIIEGVGMGVSRSAGYECENQVITEPALSHSSDIEQQHDPQNLCHSSADDSLPQQHRPQHYHDPNEVTINPVVRQSREGGKAVVLVVDGSIIGNSKRNKSALECDNEKDDNNRRTTVTKGESTWDEDEVAPQYSNDDYDVESNHHPDDTANRYHHHTATTTSHRGKCIDCLLRIVHRICHPHIHPPCSRRYWENHNRNTAQQNSHQRLSPRQRRILCRSIIILFMIVTITFTLLDLLILHQYLHHWLDSTLAWLQHNPISGGLAFIGIIVMGCLCFFPVALLSLGAGYVYIELYGLGLGIFVAFLVCYSGCILGATVCFARSRYLMRQLIIRYSAKYPIVRAVDRAFETKGFRLLLLLRLSPAMPMNALNYIGGITAISFASYWWATCVGMFPGLLWTIFVGATFGTVDARGVDGNKEFDRNGVRKGVVLGLGIGLGVMALFGTAIYARTELKKIILAEQMERATEAQVLFVHDELEVGQEDGEEEDRDSVSFESIEHSRDGWPNTRRRVSSHSSLTTLERHRGITQHQWTPETVDAELPILPKVILRCLPRPNDETTITGHERGEEANPASVWPDNFTPKNRQRSASASASPWHRHRHSSDTAKVNADASRNAGVEIISPTTRRHSDDITIRASMVTPEHNLRADTSSDTVNDMTSSLANIYETRALSDDQLFDEADSSASLITTPPLVQNESTVNRRRCNTDPTSRRNIYNVPAGAALKDISRELDSTTKEVAGGTHSLRKKQWQQSSPIRPPPPRQHDIRSRHSSGSLHNGRVILNNGEECPPPKCNSLTLLHQEPISLPPEFSRTDEHIGLDISASGDDDDDSIDTPREWFWIWS